MMRIRRGRAFVCVLLIPVTTFMIGFIHFHLDYQTVQAVKAKLYSSTFTHVQGIEARPVDIHNASHDNKSTNQEPVSMMQKNDPSKAVAPKRYHLLINSYMNSGSRFTAGLFGFRRDSFYFYEPLWKLGIWDYYHRPNYVCSSIIHNCSTKSADQVNTYRETGKPYKAVSNSTSFADPIHMLTDILNKIYQCQLTDVANLVVPRVQDDYGGPGWTKYKKCIQSKTPKQLCLSQQEQSCKSAKHIITKVLRLTTDSLEGLLQANEHIKVIQLFRDPRAVVNSRLDSAGYPTRHVTSNAQALCNKMALDYQGGVRLMEKFPGRFKFVFYEDLVSDIEENMKILYNFIGMTFNKSELDDLNRVKINNSINKDPMKASSRANDNANWWRRYISFSKYKEIDRMCTNVTERFNLTSFDSKQSLTDLTIPSMSLPSILRIK